MLGLMVEMSAPREIAAALRSPFVPEVFARLGEAGDERIIVPVQVDGDAHDAVGRILLPGDAQTDGGQAPRSAAKRQRGLDCMRNAKHRVVGAGEVGIDGQLAVRVQGLIEQHRGHRGAADIHANQPILGWKRRHYSRHGHSKFYSGDSQGWESSQCIIPSIRHLPKGLHTAGRVAAAMREQYRRTPHQVAFTAVRSPAYSGQCTPPAVRT